MVTTASMRKGMLGLFLLTGVCVMVIYWNQDSVRPLALVQTLHCEDTKLPAIQVDQTYGGGGRGALQEIEMQVVTNYHSSNYSPPELLWTYECVVDKCVRRHYFKSSSGSGSSSTNSKAESNIRVPYQTCAMTCGASSRSFIVPQPVKYSVGSHPLNFGLETIHTHILTPHKNTEKMLREAVLVFLRDLQLLQKDLVTEKRDDVEARRHTRSADGQSEAVNANADDRPGNYFNYDNKCKMKVCDIDTLNIRIAVKGRSDEVHLSLDSDERYNLSLSTARRSMEVKISADTFFGARHGLQTLSQLMWYDDELAIFRVLNEATIEDGPKFRYRGLMLDTSRHFFSVAAIKRTLMGMAHSKLNRFHWHMTDSQSFPYRSKHYPQLAQYGAYSNEEMYTPEDVKEIVDYARVRGIQVIAEIDAPAHAGNGWDWGPKHGMGELSLCINQQPWNFYCGEPPCGQLNPKNNNTYLVLEKLYQELLELTGPVDFFHMGGDEVNLECWGQHFNDTDLR